MKIYVLKLDLSLVMPRLKNFRLGEFNHNFPTIFIQAGDPDEACYMVYCKFTETILKQDDSKKTALLIKDIMPDVRVTKVYCKDEKKL